MDPDLYCIALSNLSMVMVQQTKSKQVAALEHAREAVKMSHDVLSQKPGFVEQVMFIYVVIAPDKNALYSVARKLVEGSDSCENS